MVSYNALPGWAHLQPIRHMMQTYAASLPGDSIERARQAPGREKEVWDYYRSNAQALAQLRAPIYEDKVVDFVLELANVTEKKVTKDELFKDEDAEKTAA